MNALEQKETFTTLDMVQLQTLEARIDWHIRETCANWLEVGRLLCKVRDQKLVPHGEWSGWLRRTADMSERGAERLMAAARSAPEGSALSKLPISKITAILALPAEEREPMAEKAIEGNMSVRELTAEIAKEKTHVGELKDAYKNAIKREEESNRLKIDAENENQRLRVQCQDYRKIADQYNEMRMEAERKVSALQAQLDDLLAQPAVGISAEAQAEIDRLNAELEEQARLRQEAQQMALSSMLTGADAIEPERRGFSPDDLVTAVRTFIGSVGIMAHMGPELSRLPASDIGYMLSQVAMVRRWCADAEKALNVQRIEV